MGQIVSSLNQEPAPITPVLDISADALEALIGSLLQSTSATEQRSAVVECLEKIVQQMDQARDIWQSYADNPVQQDGQYTAVMWIGPERSRDLHRIRLSLRDLARRLSEVGGVAFHDTIGISPQVDVVDAYSQLLPDETGASRAADSIDTLDKRLADIRNAIARLG